MSGGCWVVISGCIRIVDCLWLCSLAVMRGGLGVYGSFVVLGLLLLRLLVFF